MASLLWSVCTDQKIDGPDWQGDILVQHLGDGALRPLELPQWMFDRAVCCTMRLTEEPSVSCSALFELKELLRATAVTGESAVIGLVEQINGMDALLPVTNNSTEPHTTEA